MACPDCRKKVSEDYGVMSCVICNKSYKSSQPKPTYMLSAVIHDATGDILVQFPREFGDPIMNGLSAPAFKDLKESTQNVKRLVQSCFFKVSKVILPVLGTLNSDKNL